MPDKSLFSRSNSEGGDDDPAEGVRLIGADEAEQAVERGDSVRRREADEPRFGDRPQAPPRDVSPSLRFPLAETTDPSSIERLKVAPVVPRRAPGHVESSGPLPSDPSATQDTNNSSSDAGEYALEPPTGEIELPHWTEPPTGEVPKVIIGDVEQGNEVRDTAHWVDYTASMGPRWRDQYDSGEGADVTTLADLEDDSEGSRFGALDTTDRPSQEEFLSFDDLVAPEAAAPQGRPEGRERRSSRRGGPTGGGRVDSGEPGQSRRGTAPPTGGDGGSRDVTMAAFVGIAVAAVSLILFKIGPGVTMILVVGVLGLAAAEFFNAVFEGGFRPATFLGLAAVVSLPLAAYWRGEAGLPVVLFLAVVFSLLWYLFGVSGQHIRVLPNLGVTLLGIVWIGLLGAFAALILRIPGQGVSILLLAVVAAVLADVGGFFVGSRFGSRQLAAVSPNKTVEGLVGGVIASLIGVVVFGSILGFGPLSFGQLLVFGLLTGVAAPFGDLSESLIKRDLGIKDMGSILPGHGGLMDRFDGLLFVLPVAYYVARSFAVG